MTITKYGTNPDGSKTAYRKSLEDLASLKFKDENFDSLTTDELIAKMKGVKIETPEERELRLALTQAENCLTVDGLKGVFNKYPELQNDKDFIDALTKAKEKLTRIV